MPPQTPIDPLSPVPRRRWPLSRRSTLIAGGAAIVTIGAVSFGLLSSSKHPVGSSDTLQKAYYDRPGYDRKQLSSAIADPAALTLKPSYEAINSSKTGVVIPACSVLSPADLKASGLLLTANSFPTAIERTYFDGVGQSSFRRSEYTLPLTEESNNCRYGLESGGSITVDAYQPLTTSPAAIQDEITRRYTAAPAIAGVNDAEIFQLKKPDGADTATYLVRQGDMTLGLRFEFKTDLSTKSTQLIKQAMVNMARLKTKPEGPATAHYDSPVFQPTSLHACALMNNADLHQLTGSDASPLVTEGLASSIGLMTFRSLGDDTPYHYIQNECSRSNTGLGSGLIRGEAFNQTLTITATSYDAAKGAEHAMAHVADHAKSQQAVAGVGDGAVVYNNSVDQSIFAFRKGRFLVELNLDNVLQKTVGLNVPANMATKLTSFAQKAAAQIQE